MLKNLIKFIKNTIITLAINFEIPLFSAQGVKVFIEQTKAQNKPNS